jgi:putative oxidoreductase
MGDNYEGKADAMRFGIAILRAAIGGLFIGHGLQKLTGAFGGHGWEGTAGFVESTLGLKPGKVHATAAGAAEAGGGALLVAGLATPFAASAITGVMTVAVRKVHLQHGVWSSDGGYEYNAVLAAALFAITADGPGSPALDRRRWGLPWAIAELAAGVGGGLAMLKFAERGTAAPPVAGDPANQEGRFERDAAEATASGIA